VHETVFKNRLGHLGEAFRDGVERHELGLHVGGEAGVFSRAERLRLQATMRLDADEAVARSDRGTRFAQLVDNRIEVIGAAMHQDDIAARCRHGAQKGTGFDTVRHHLVRAAVQALHALNADAVAAVALNARTHLDEHLGQVADFGLLRRVFENGFTFGQGRCHQEVLGSSHGHHVGRDAGALQAFLPCR